MRFQPSEGLGRAESPGNGSCPANTVSDKKKHGKSKWNKKDTGKMVRWNQLALIVISHFLFLITDSIFRRPDLERLRQKPYGLLDQHWGISFG